jgi:hypothetical protein
MTMVEAADAEDAVATGMRVAGLQIRQLVEDAAEDQRGERYGRLERITDEIPEMVFLQP